MGYVWLAVLLLSFVLEAVTVSLTSIWFSFGALAALVGLMIGAQIWLQIVLFVVVFAAAVYFTRPLAKKYVNSRKKPTNADRVLEMTGVVTEEINNLNNTGAVSAGGKLWTARSLYWESIPVGTAVKPIRIDGVKLIVVKQEANVK